MNLIKKLFSHANDKQIMHAQMAVGNSFKEFCESDVGRYLIGRAEQEEISVLREMAKTNPVDEIAIIQLQERAKHLSGFVGWIEQVINEGEAAAFQLDEITAQEIGY